MTEEKKESRRTSPSTWVRRRFEEFGNEGAFEFPRVEIATQFVPEISFASSPF